MLLPAARLPLSECCTATIRPHRGLCICNECWEVINTDGTIITDEDDEIETDDGYKHMAALLGVTPSVLALLDEE